MRKTITFFLLCFVLTACQQSGPSSVDHPVAADQTPIVKSNTPDLTHQSNEPKPEKQKKPITSLQPAKTGLTAPSDLVPVVVSEETDGDTLHVTMPDGSEEKIRLLLIDTPEDVDPRKPVEPFGLKAASFARHKLPAGKHVYLEEGKPGYKRDKYRRLLAYVWINKHDLYNADVVKKGLARVAYIYPPNTDHLALLRKKQHYAKNHDLGIWSISNYVTPDGYNLAIACRWADQHGLSDRGCPASGSPESEHHSNGASSTGHSSKAASIEMVSSNLDVSPGQYASVTIKTSPGATGSIEVDYKSGPSSAAGLETKTAGSSGRITWQWMVGTRTTPGKWPVKITVGGQTVTKILHVR
ncbi:MAG TPA: thermonuclease family protein [Bacillales bacterium]|nr:thermonuclease family protein [Bacillales bacterium]